MGATTLTAGVAVTDTTISIASVTDLAGDRTPPYDVAVNAEEMHVTAESGGVLTVIRGQQTNPQVYVTDPFDRTEDPATRWNLSDDGQSWWQGTTTDANNEYEVSGGRGKIHCINASPGSAPAFVMANPQLDLQVRFKFYLTDDVDTLMDVYLRCDENPTVDSYRARLTVAAAGTLSLRLSKNVATVNTALAAAVVPPGTVALSDQVNLAFQAVGNGTTDLAAKAWRTVDGEPTAWQTTVSDSEAILQVPNHSAMRVRFTNADRHLEVDDYTVSLIPAGVSHTNGDDVVLIENWPFPTDTVVGFGAPLANPRTGSFYLDADASPPVLYYRVGAVWRVITLT